jgi:hypothetical protein
MTEEETSKEYLVAGAKFDYADLDDLTTKGTLTMGHTTLEDWAGLRLQYTDKTNKRGRARPLNGRLFP